MLKPGIRYNVINPDGTLLGYLIDGSFYEISMEEEIGEIRDGTFYYARKDGSGLQFPEGIAGHVDGMEIVRVGDGVRFQLIEVEDE